MAAARTHSSNLFVEEDFGFGTEEELTYDIPILTSSLSTPTPKLSKTRGQIEATSSSTNDLGANAESIKVLVRVRPLDGYIDGGDETNTSAVDIQSNTSLAVVANDKRSFQCTFDNVLGPYSTQKEVYSIVKSCTESVLDGFNSTIFAYGQTGSGKTYSMYGPPTENGSRTNMSNPDVIGLIPRAINDIFELGNKSDKGIIKLSVYCSFVQIYNEQLYDMLRDASMGCPLTIREDLKEIYVQGLSEYNVKNMTDTLQLLKLAEDNRAIRETHMNLFSSRSHSIFQIYVEQKRFAADGGEISLKSKFNLVDLAGSEKWNTKTFLKDEHITEMNNINLSLHTLGRCISSLAQKSKGVAGATHIPYRESKLTRLLQDSLGGNAKTYLIATISPAKSNVEETISTLKFADRAKQVMVQATINETRPIDHEMVQKLQKENEYLRNLLQKYSNGNSTSASIELSASTPSAISSSNNNGIILTLQNALQNEKDKVAQVTNENKILTNEIAMMKHKSRNDSMNTVNSQQLQEKIDVYSGENNRLWECMDKIQVIFKRFFKFEIEEDDMKSSLESIFSLVQSTKNDHKNRMLIEQKQHEQKQQNSENRPSNTHNNETKKNILHDLKQIGNMQHNSPVQPTLYPSHSDPNIGMQMGVANNRLPTLNQSTTPHKSQPLSANPSTRPHRYDQQASPSRIVSAAAAIPVRGRDLPPKQPALPSVGASQPAPKYGRNISDQIQLPLSSLSPSNKHDQYTPLKGVSFRVRGSIDQDSVGENEDGGWMQAAPSAEEEEEMLQRELKKAKKKLKKQQQMQQWLREKEEKQLALLKQEEDERKAALEAEMLREKKRREYAQKQKQKLAGYQDRIRTEAESIQELYQLGIDPSELM